MEVWSLETEGGERLGYRIKTDRSNVYDIKSDIKILGETIVGSIHTHGSRPSVWYSQSS